MTLNPPQALMLVRARPAVAALVERASSTAAPR